ncbi:MAG: hypothetical protein HY670_11535 [Chloroflexi bacterium]|nr:hypothetical protein [Chloroflexota bacterium]
MRSRHSALLCLILLVSLVFGGCRLSVAPSPETASAPSAQSQPDNTASATGLPQTQVAKSGLVETDREYWEAIRSLLQKTLLGVSQVRELAAPQQVGFQVVTSDWAAATWGDKYVRDDARKIEINERIYKSLFILPDTVSLSSLYARWPRSYIAAVLQDEVYFVRENFIGLKAAEARKTLAHEVAHLLQGQHFRTTEAATYDEQKAWSALTEGDADFTRTKYLQGAGPAEPLPEILSVNLSPIPSSQTETPQAFTRLLYFAYDYGEALVSSLYREGGWTKVNEMYALLQLTTEQVMHPEKLLIREGPKAIKTPAPKIADWQLVKTDRLGEHFVKVMLETRLAGAEAARAARGWGNDRLTYYEGPQSYLVAWQTAWDSDADAMEFYQAFLTMLEKPGGAMVGADLWSVRGQYLRVTQAAEDVLIIVSQDRDMVETAAKALRP